MANIPSNLQRIIDEGYEFNFGDYISKGFSMLMRNLGGYIGFYLLFFAIAIGLSIIPIIGVLALAVIAPALVIGPNIVAHKLDNDQPTQFSDFFKGFERFGDLFLAALLVGLITFAAIIPGYAVLFYSIFSHASEWVGSVDPEDPYSILDVYTRMFGSPVALVAMLMILIPAAYLSVSFIWTANLVWFNNMGAWDAMMASRKIVGKQFWIILLFMIVIGLIGALGIIGLGIGILFTYPAMQLANFAAFTDVTKLNEAEEAGDVLDHFAPAQ